MDTTTVAIVIGSNIVVAAASFGIGWLQNKQADKRLQWESAKYNEEYKRQIEAVLKTRIREVKSEPLLKLRAESAKMAAMMEKAIRCTILFSGDKKVTLYDLGSKALDEFSNYWFSGNWENSLFALDDRELIESAEKLWTAYSDCILAFDDFKSGKEVNNQKSVQLLSNTRKQMIQFQALINQRLQLL